MVLVRQKDKQKPIQLNRKATLGQANTTIVQFRRLCSQLYRFPLLNKAHNQVEAGSDAAKPDKVAILYMFDGGQKRKKLTEKCQHEDPVIPDPELVGVAEVVPGWEVVVLEAPLMTHKERMIRPGFGWGT